MLNPIGLTHGHYECRVLDETLPIFTDLLAMQVVERGEGEAVVQHPNTSWRLVVHEGGPDAPDKPHNNHYGVRVARSAEVDAAHEYLEANKARYGLKRVSRPSAQHFAKSIYFSEPGGNTLEIEYYDPQAAAEGRSIAAPHWQRELAESDFPGVRQAPLHAVVPRSAADAQAQETAAAGEPVHADDGLCGRRRKRPPRARFQGHRAAGNRARRELYFVPLRRPRSQLVGSTGLTSPHVKA